ncbi:Endoribonuclease YbeY [Acropora cervicornis]|uniref:Endoribonuclease YbeY n=1 Tax=Acropora cervicornis TaxID=6130 RepID=A0AAD9R074_ACRCE|nr:Endoribonuclease YbeY [Acropora cervicornis]
MVALIKNLQTRTILNIPLLLQNSNSLLEILRICHFDVNLVFVGKGFIKSLNLRYRRRNVTTDILAFPYLQFPRPGVPPKLPLKPYEHTLGDIVLGTPQIKEDCESDGVELDSYLPVIITHGLCHLMGYTHDTQENLDMMRSKEVEVLTEFNKRTGYNTVPITPRKLNLYRIRERDKKKMQHTSTSSVEEEFDIDVENQILKDK